MKPWPEVALATIANPVSRPVAVLPGQDYRTIGVKWWGEGAYERETIDGSRTAAKTLSVVRQGDLIINKIWVRHGSTAIAGPEVDGCAASGEFPTFELDCDRVLPEWVHWQTKTRVFWSKCDALSRGTSGKNRIKPELFLTIRIPLPPLPEQRRIVARIEELAAPVNEARTLRKQATEDTQDLWARGASEIFDRAIETYPIRPLANLVTIRGGGTPSKSDPFYWEGKIPWITPKDMKRRELSNAIDHISERATQETAAKLILPGAVLVVVRGMILAHTFPSAVLRTPATINQDMKALLPNRELLPEFLCTLFWAANSRILEVVAKSTHDTRKLETHKLLDTKIVVPPLAEQRRIVAELDALQNQVDALKRLQTETATELDALLPAILDRAFKRGL